MVTLRAYFDESGHSKDQNWAGVLAIGGAIAPLVKWESFEEDWKGVLDRFGVPWFHATDYAHSRKEFEGWERDESRRRDFMKGLLSTLRSHGVAPIGAVIPLISHKLKSIKQQSAIDDPYHLCLSRCLEIVASRTERLPEGEQAQVIFAKVQRLVGRSAEIFGEFQEASPFGHRMAGITLNLSPGNVIPLQAADLVAYELACYMKADQEQIRELREPMRQLLELEHEFECIPYFGNRSSVSNGL